MGDEAPTQNAEGLVSLFEELLRTNVVVRNRLKQKTLVVFHEIDRITIHHVRKGCQLVFRVGTTKGTLSVSDGSKRY